MDDKCIKIDAPRLCPHCNTVVQHALTVYIDAEYGVCFRCGTHTTWTPGQGDLEVTQFRARDSGKQVDDFKRAADRKYRKQGKTWDYGDD